MACTPHWILFGLSNREECLAPFSCRRFYLYCLGENFLDHSWHLQRDKQDIVFMSGALSLKLYGFLDNAFAEEKSRRPFLSLPSLG